MTQNTEMLQTDESAEKLRALSKLLGTPEPEDGADAAETAEILYALMESGDPDALAFLKSNPELCLSQYGEGWVRAIMEKTKKGVENIP